MCRSGELGRGVGLIRSAWVEGGRTTVEVKLGDRKATFELLLVAHLTTNVDQGNTSELPLDLCPGRCHFRRISRRAKGREYTTVLPVGICQELMAL